MPTPGKRNTALHAALTLENAKTYLPSRRGTYALGVYAGDWNRKHNCPPLPTDEVVAAVLAVRRGYSPSNA